MILGFPLSLSATIPSYAFITTIENSQVNNISGPTQFNGFEILLQNQFSNTLSLDITTTSQSENNTTSLSLDEIYISYSQLPLNTTVSIGKKLVTFGKLNQMATEEKPFNDTPLAFTSLVGDGLSGDIINIHSQTQFLNLTYSLTPQHTPSTDESTQSYSRHSLRAGKTISFS